MRLNEKNVASFAVCSSPVDKEGYLQKKGGDLNREFQRRWFVLKGNLLFYFLKKQDREPQGVIVLEACSVQVSGHGRYSFEISFDGAGTRVYVLGADNSEEMECWMKAISHASYEYLKSIVDELQRRVNYLTSNSSPGVALGIDGHNVGAAVNASSSSASSGYVSSMRDTMVTLRDLNNPIAPTQHKRYSSPASNATKIEKGVLVDIGIDDKAPPVPAKKKSSTINASGQTTVSSGSSTSYTDRLIHHQTEFDRNQMDALILSEEPHPSTSSTHNYSSRDRDLHPPIHPSPYSSPIIPKVPLENKSKQLSPPSTLDRTPVLQPLSAAAHQNKTSTRKSQNIKDDSKLTIGKKDEHFTASTNTTRHTLPPGGAFMPSSHPPQANSRKLAAPPDSRKTFMEMHEDFAQAMKNLNAERTSANY